MENFPKDIYRKKYITTEDDNIIRVLNTSVILLIFVSDIYFLYV